MKTHLLIVFLFITLITMGCEPKETSFDSSHEKMGLLNNYQQPNFFSDSLQFGSEINNQIPVFWTIGSVFESYFKVIKINDYSYQFLLIDKHDGIGGTDDMRGGWATLIFKPTNTGIYSLFIIDRQDTFSKRLVVY